MQSEASNGNLTLVVDFTMSYESLYYNVTLYPQSFQNWTNSNLDTVLVSMETLSFNVTAVDKVKRIVVKTPAPSMSLAPSFAPSFTPTKTPFPSMGATETLTKPPSNTLLPGTNTENESLNTIIISTSVIIALAIVGVGVCIYYRKRRSQFNELQPDSKKVNSRGAPVSETHSGTGWGTNTGASPNVHTGTSDKAYGSSFGRPADVPSGLEDAGASPGGSVISNRSLISRGASMGADSRDEADSAHILEDEFDQYKDQNLEKMRADIEEDLPQCDGMMSQAVSRALIDQDDETFDSSNYWGGDGSITVAEIEASVLGLVWDWVKRNDKVSDRERQAMMQEQLNKMTASVLHKVIGPDDATRTIHECAVLLGFQLASDLTVTTIVISGMRKKATEDDVRKAFSVFGDVAVAAVAPNFKGFGMLRFKSSNSVDRAMKKFRTSEVVVEDVAVQLKAIQTGRNTDDTESNGGSKII